MQPCTGSRCPMQMGYHVEACDLGDHCPYYTQLDKVVDNKILDLLINSFPKTMPYSERYKYVKDSVDKAARLISMSVKQ